MATEKDLYKLTSVDEHGGRLGIIPAEVRGKFRTWRNRVHAVLLLIFLALPWITHNGHQLVLLNIPAREFNFFGFLFRAHDAPLIFFILIILVMALALVTAVWGRIWCGWACPQTVFIDFVYRKIEVWVEGNYIERRKLAAGPWTFNKFWRQSLKWLLFTIVSSLIAHSFIAYFSGAKELLQMMTRPPGENWSYFLLVSVVTFLILFDFAWFREQFCVIMCPYGRIQSVLLEPNSLAVVYDQNRGEPRKGAGAATEKRGDCISCSRCVEVCPTGIDIRNGLQMECIACTACIDACDEIMAKVKKPAGLIGYKTLNNTPLQFFKAKTIFYGIAILLAFAVLSYNLIQREPLNIALLRGKEAPYTLLKNDNGQSSVQNHFRLHLTNQTDVTSNYQIALSEESTAAGLTLTLAQNPITLKSKSSETVHLFLQISSDNLPANGKLNFSVLLTHEDGQQFRRNLIFIGPYK